MKKIYLAGSCSSEKRTLMTNIARPLVYQILRPAVQGGYLHRLRPAAGVCYGHSAGNSRGENLRHRGARPLPIFRRAGPPGRLHHSLELHPENRPGYRPGGDKAQRLPGSPGREGLFVLTATRKHRNHPDIRRIFLDFFGNNTCNPYGFQI